MWNDGIEFFLFVSVPAVTTLTLRTETVGNGMKCMKWL